MDRKKTVLKTVLIVDDEPALARALVRMVGRIPGIEECTLLHTHDPKDAVIMALSQPSKTFFLITDTNMPGMTGDQLIRELRSHLGDRLRRAILASGNIENQARAKEVGADHFLSKPFSHDDWEPVQRMLEAFIASC